MRAGWLVIAGIAAAASCGGRETADDAVESVRADTVAARPAARPTIVFMGTSLTAGLGLDPADAYPALIQRTLDSAGFRYRVVNAGQSGETSAGALRRLDWVLRGPVDLFVLETGANDGLRGLNIDSTRANIQTIVERVRARHPEARIALVQMEAPPNLGPDYTRRFRDMYRQVAERNDITLLPFLLEGVAGVPALNQPDGIHPNEAGERIVAANVYRALRPLLDAPAGADGAAVGAGGR